MTANPGKPGLNRARARGGRASPNEQQSLSFEPLRATADRDQLRNPSQRTDVEAARGAPLTATIAAPKARTDEETSTMATMTMTMTATHTKDSTPTPLISAVIACLNVSFDSVAANRGAPGPDRVTIDQLRKHWPAVINDLGNSLADGTYRVGDIRRVWIPKASGGQRALGIPNVIDRVVQEAVRRTIEPIFEPTFHESSHGFRPGRSCHTAVAQARQHLEEGHEWVVDLDLEKFFDSVHHQRLLARIGLRVNDPALLALINQMLRAKVVLPDGVVINNEEGVPQGGPLSPLLSNIVLSELDEELAQREHRFVRYADDCNIYVRSERAGQRVMESVTRFIERRMRLKVNRGKSAVALAGDRHFVGFRIMRNAEDGTTEVIPSQRSVTRLYARVKELTPRNWGGPLAVMIAYQPFEHGAPLRSDEIRRFDRRHPRCGTAFLLVVALTSILVHALIGHPSWPVLVASRLLGLPVVAGLAYEAIRFAGRHPSSVVGRLVRAPGEWLQSLTTAPPDDDMIEVAVAALEAVLVLEAEAAEAVADVDVTGAA